MIKAKNLKVGYEQKIIIEDLSIDIEKGQVVSILGPNGSGKSTLLKALSRMIKPKSGEIYIENQKLTDIKNKKISQKLCLLSQHNTVPGDISVEDLVYFGRMPHKKWYETKLKEDEEIVNWAIENVGLTKYKNTPVSTLSGGERQRIGLARAFLSDAPCILLDEPTSNLDVLNEAVILSSLQQQKNKTIILVSHRESTMKIADKVIEMDMGRMS